MTDEIGGIEALSDVRYVYRNENGDIEAVYSEPQAFTEEAVAIDNPELVQFLLGGQGEATLRSHLAASDADLLRVVEDLINVLIEKNLVLMIDFPEAARQKLMHRAAIRKKLEGFGNFAQSDKLG